MTASDAAKAVVRSRRNRKEEFQEYKSRYNETNGYLGQNRSVKKD